MAPARQNHSEAVFGQETTEKVYYKEVVPYYSESYFWICLTTGYVTPLSSLDHHIAQTTKHGLPYMFRNNIIIHLPHMYPFPLQTPPPQIGEGGIK